MTPALSCCIYLQWCSPDFMNERQYDHFGDIWLNWAGCKKICTGLANVVMLEKVSSINREQLN